jgi:transcriptional regulator with XRE-family HTH domain
MTQHTLAQIIGVTRSAMSGYELSTTYPSYEVLVGISDLFNVTTDYVLGREKTRIVNAKGLTEYQIVIVAQLVRGFQEINEERRTGRYK